MGVKEEKIDLHKSLLDQMHELYIKKNNDYGDSVHDTYERYGLTSFLVRMEDKLNRLRTLDTKRDSMKVTDERIEDTLMDLANYAILAIIEEKFRLKDLCSEVAEEVKLNPFKEQVPNTQPFQPVQPFNPNDYPFGPTITYDAKSQPRERNVFNYESQEYKDFKKADEEYRKSIIGDNLND